MDDNSKNVFLYRYDGASQGGKLMARILGTRIIRTEGSKFSGGRGKTVINWGSSNFPYALNGAHIENKPEAVANATNKLTFFNTCRINGGVEFPRFTTRKAEARDWIHNKLLVFARTKLQGSGGDGIVVCSTPEHIDRFPEGTLFVEYVKKKFEYRIHVADGKVIDVQEKRKRKGIPLEVVDYRIRNLANGFVFCRQEVEPVDAVKQNAINAVVACGLDFGAVDVVYNQHNNRVAVLEVNTAPGVEGSTAVAYFKHFAKKFGLDDTKVNDRYDVEKIADDAGL